jgi:hypothetical protein
VPTEVKELYTSSPKNQKSVTVIETIIADRREPPLPFITAPSQKIIDNWIAKSLLGMRGLLILLWAILIIRLLYNILIT